MQMPLRRLFQLTCLCLSLTGPFAIAQSPTEPFRFGEVDLEFLDQINQFDKKLEEQGLVYRNAELTAYVDRVGRSLLTPADEIENVKWNFRVLRDPSINAFALANGSIYVHTGLLATMENEAQFASVLAHEIIHVRHRHSYLGYRSYRKKSLTINILSIVGTYTGGIGGVLSSAAQFILAVTIIGHSRELERDADQSGLQRIQQSPYEPGQMVEALSQLKNKAEVDLDGEPFYGSHPKLKERLEYLGEIIKKAGTARTLSAEEQAAVRTRYQTSAADGMRHNVALAADAGLYRSAVTQAQRLVELQPENVANLTALADAYTALGPRPLEPTEEEKSGKGKREARKRRNKLTLDEETKTLAATEKGKPWQAANFAEADKLYQRALALDEKYALAWRGLGELQEKREQPQAAVTAYQKYLEHNSGAMDRLMIMRRIKTLESKSALDAAKPQ
jgi:predicted Zn-dependent protease